VVSAVDHLDLTCLMFSHRVQGAFMEVHMVTAPGERRQPGTTCPIGRTGSSSATSVRAPVLSSFAIWRDGMELWKRLESVSAYYYTGASLFAGMLVALALFLSLSWYANQYPPV